ncbi:MAG: xylulokinase [Actinobacteria bacterium]|nr:xylulokinase [Actinomycetota bacterium]
MPLVAGVDSSTSGCKVEVRDLDTGELVSSGRAPHPATTPPRSEQHPRDWWLAFESAAGIAGVLTDRRPDAIAVAGQQHGLVVLDEDEGVLRPAKLWNDTESAPEAAELVEALGAEAWATACGSVPVASFTITKLAWLRRHEPDTYRRVRHVLLPHDWLTRRLTGRITTDRGDASGTGWWSPAEGRYRADLLALVDPDRDWPDLLPPVLGPTEPAGTWGTGADDPRPDGTWGTRPPTVVGPGTGDNMAAALGLGMGPGDLALSFGTSGTAFTVSDSPSADASGTVAGFADATGRFLPLVCTLNATKVTDAVARLLGVSAAELDELALAAPPGAGGLVLVPHLDGERTPNRPHATGLLAGIRSDVSREQLARAAVEGVVCNLLAGADQLPADASGRVLLVGGGARSRAYQQVAADLLGRPVVVPDADELVALGAAVQAAVALTGRSFAEVAEAWNLGRGLVVEPSGETDAPGVRAAHAATVAER